jgi:hypothetical protein
MKITSQDIAHIYQQLAYISKRNVDFGHVYEVEKIRFGKSKIFKTSPKNQILVDFNSI